MTTTVSPELTPIRPRMRLTMAVGAAALFAGLGAGLLLDDAFSSAPNITEPAPANVAVEPSPSQGGATESDCTSGPVSADAAERCLTALRTPPRG